MHVCKPATWISLLILVQPFCYVASGHIGGSSAPKMADLANRCAAIIPDKWKQVAIQLGLSHGEIKAIQNDEGDSFAQFMAVFDRWKQSSSEPYSWKTLVTALRSKSVNEIKLANELHNEFC